MTMNPEDPDQKEPEIEIKPTPSESKKKDEGKAKFSETIENLKKSENIDNLIQYAQNNVQDTIAYALMAIGIIWTFFHGFYGGILIGLVAGFYFSKEIVKLIKNYNDFIEEQGTARSLIAGGTALALFIAAPGIFIGAAIMIGLKVMLRAD